MPDTSPPPVHRVTIVVPCFNEVDNVGPLRAAVQAVFATEPLYAHRMLFIDNASTDGTGDRLRQMAAADPTVRVILNARNFGWVRSPMHAIREADGDAAILMAADFQDPPELLHDFLRSWEAGSYVVLGQKTQSDENRLMYGLRTLYYRTLARLSSVDLPRHVTGFGLYDRRFLDVFRSLNDPTPYLRGLVAEIGLPLARVPFHQPKRRFGVTKSNFYLLYDQAMLGITNHSKVPLRLMTMAGFAMSLGSFLLAVAYLIAKLVFWSYFTLGTAPLLIAMFFIASVQLFCLGVWGEYIGAIHTNVQNRPLVVEKERINFGPPAG
ncbi:MAG: glycosyltransferase family 2 protein [Fimbriiglobus sp.]